MTEDTSLKFNKNQERLAALSLIFTAQTNFTQLQESDSNNLLRYFNIPQSIKTKEQFNDFIFEPYEEEWKKTAPKFESRLNEISKLALDPDANNNAELTAKVKAFYGDCRQELGKFQEIAQEKHDKLMTPVFDSMSESMAKAEHGLDSGLEQIKMYREVFAQAMKGTIPNPNTQKPAMVLNENNEIEVRKAIPVSAAESREAQIQSAFADIQKATKDLNDHNVNGNNDPQAIKQFLAAAGKLKGSAIKLADGVDLSDKSFLDSNFSNQVAKLQVQIGEDGKVTREEIDKTVAMAEEMATGKEIKTSGDSRVAAGDAVDPTLLSASASRKLQVAAL